MTGPTPVPAAQPSGRPPLWTGAAAPTPGTGRGDRGSVTAELAAALPALVLLLVVGLTAISAAGAKLRCVDAAREAALVAARGGDGVAASGHVGPAGAAVAIRTEGELIRAVVEAPVRPLGRHLPGFGVSATAVAATEPGPP